MAHQLNTRENIWDINKANANQVMEGASRLLSIDKQLINMKLCFIWHFLLPISSNASTTL